MEKSLRLANDETRRGGCPDKAWELIYILSVLIGDLPCG
jgi:hypothetical protein